ncbi:MAG: sigma-70 family RNA polymerase sigma factor [Polyangiaceae bacterium]|jgi:RNA polymerase sigma-70 factor (ECF subfamily)
MVASTTSVVSGELPTASAGFEHLDALFRLARYLTGSDANAEDLVQETFEHAFGASRQAISRTHLRAGLLRLLRNAYLEKYRSDRSHPDGASLQDDDPPEEEGQARKRASLGDEERLRELAGADIERALASLSVDVRTLILLDIEGLSGSELAEVLGYSVDTITSRLYRARALLRERLCVYSS